MEILRTLPVAVNLLSSEMYDGLVEEAIVPSDGDALCVVYKMDKMEIIENTRREDNGVG